MDEREIFINITGKIVKCSEGNIRNKYIVKVKISNQEYNSVMINKTLLVGKVYNIRTVIKWNKINNRYENIVKPVIIELNKRRRNR